MKVTTSKGREYEIIDGALDDMELLDALIDIDAGNMIGLRNVIITLLGDDGRKKLYENNRGENGRVSASAVLEELHDILTNAPKEVKNS
mgnify:CR=1 FL=1